MWFAWKILSLPQMKTVNLSGLIVRSKSMAIVLALMVIASGLLSLQSGNAVEKSSSFGKTCFRAASGDVQSVAVRPHSISKEINSSREDHGLKEIILSSLVKNLSSQRKFLRSFQSVSFRFDGNCSVFLFLCVILR